MNMALVGNPNCGKTVFFNKLTGAKQKVANFPGVTVEKVSGRIRFLHQGERVLDLPGIYSFNKNSEDARIATEILISSAESGGTESSEVTGSKAKPKKPFDLSLFSNKTFGEDCHQNSKLSPPVGDERVSHLLIIMDSTSFRKGLTLAIQALSLKIPALVVLNMEDELISRGGKIDKELLAERLGVPVFSVSATKGWGMNDLMRAIKHYRETFQISKKFQDLNDLEETSIRSNKLADETLISAIKSHKLTDKLDAVFLHRIFGPVSFLIIFLLVFQSIFTWVTPLMDWVELFFCWLAKAVDWALADGVIKNMLIQGVIGGVGSVLVFLPQIMVLFAFIGFMEFSGYMPRASFVMDRIMAKFGLQGKSFLPLMSSYACAIPGILATRTIESKRERMITIFISPLTTCSARLPVYVILISSFVEDVNYLGGIIGLRTLVMFSLYILGLASALITAYVLKKIFGQMESLPYVQDIPPYRFPTLLVMYNYILQRAKLFVKRAGKVIFTVTVVLWVLASFPQNQVERYGTQASYVGQLGKVIEPVIEPLGFDWKIGVGLITSLAAREVVISTLSTINGIDESGDEEVLVDMFRNTMDLPSAISLLIYFVFALQCLATVATARRETGGWKIPLLMFTYMLVLAYIFSFIAYNISTALWS